MRLVIQEARLSSMRSIVNSRISGVDRTLEPLPRAIYGLLLEDLLVQRDQVSRYKAGTRTCTVVTCRELVSNIGLNVS
jgi:hypothetical protein